MRCQLKKLMRLVHERGVSLNLPHEREELKKADISVCPKYYFPEPYRAVSAILRCINGLTS